MPTYEYECEACEHHFDELQSMKDEPLKKCPKCGKKKLRRVIGTGAGIIFRGSGFYITDYRSESYKAAAKADQEGSKSGGEGKTESKGADNGKSESKSSDSTGSAKSPTKSSKSSK